MCERTQKQTLTDCVRHKWNKEMCHLQPLKLYKCECVCLLLTSKSFSQSDSSENKTWLALAVCSRSSQPWLSLPLTPHFSSIFGFFFLLFASHTSFSLLSLLVLPLTFRPSSLDEPHLTSLWWKKDTCSHTCVHTVVYPSTPSTSIPTYHFLLFPLLSSSTVCWQCKTPHPFALSLPRITWLSAAVAMETIFISRECNLVWFSSLSLSLPRPFHPFCRTLIPLLSPASSFPALHPSLPL